MVADYLAVPEPLALLYEPDRPKPGGRAFGWQREWRRDRGVLVSRLVRHHEDDTQGAIVQHAIARYVLTNVKRADVAAMLCVTERGSAYYLRGVCWGSYGRPVLRALKRLGINRGRGNWTTGGGRAREVVEASRAVMARAADALEGAPPTPLEVERLLADLRLLAVTVDGGS